MKKISLLLMLILPMIVLMAMHSHTHLPAHEGQSLFELGEFSPLPLYLSLSLSVELAVLQARGGAVG